MWVEIVGSAVVRAEIAGVELAADFEDAVVETRPTVGLAAIVVVVVGNVAVGGLTEVRAEVIECTYVVAVEVS